MKKEKKIKYRKKLEIELILNYFENDKDFLLTRGSQQTRIITVCDYI